MNTQQNLKVKRVKLIGSLYFAILGIGNLIISNIYGEFKFMDLVILVFSFLPLFINKKVLLLFFGSAALIISLYIIYACLTFSMDPKVQTSSTDLLMGFLSAFFSLIASLALIYVSLQSADNEKEFSLI